MVSGYLWRIAGRATCGGAAGAIVALILAAYPQSAACQDVTESSAAVAVSAGPPETATPARVRLMSRQQYVNMIADVFGADIKPGSPFVPLRRTDGLLASGAASAGMTGGQLMQFERSAVSIAAQVVDSGNLDLKIPSHRDYLVPCTPKAEDAPDDACAARFIRATGRLLFRRPVDESRVRDFVVKAHAAAASLKDFYAGIAGVVEAMLVDPFVLMIVDQTEPDPNHPTHRRLDAYSLASRLSFFLWNSIPNAAVLRAAESGELNTTRGRARVVDMMLASPRVENGVRAFFDDMFGFDDFDTLSKDVTIYPGITGTVLKDAREQTLQTVVDHLITRQRDYRDLFTTRDTFLSPALAAIYQVPTLPGWRPYEFPADSPRVGILTQVSFLAVHSHPARSSPTLRGKALRELLLCQKVPAPPPNVDMSAVEDSRSPLKTARERLIFHRQNPVCAGCHRITDPMGLALEHFDGGGQYRDSERGAPIDVSGSLDGKDFTDVAGLEQAVHDHPALPNCLVRRVFSYGVGGPLGHDDEAQVTDLGLRFAQSGYRFPDLLRAIALSNAFSEVVDPPVASSAMNNADGASPRLAAQ